MWRKEHLKALAAALGVVGAVVVGAGPAGADPARNSDVLTIDCEGLGPLAIAVFSNGTPSPGLVTTNNQVVIPYELHLSGTFTPVVGEPEGFTEEFVKPGPRNGRLDTCTFHDEGSDEFGSFVLDGTVKVSYSPAP